MLKFSVLMHRCLRSPKHCRLDFTYVVQNMENVYHG